MEGLLFLAQDGPPDGPVGMLLGLVGLFLMFAMFAGIWKIFEKAGQPGWACIIPIYNIIVLLRVARLSSIFVLAFFCPLVNIIVAIYVWMRIARSFGQSEALGCVVPFMPFIFIPLIGFSANEYRPID